MEHLILHVTYRCKEGAAEEFIRAVKESGAQALVRAEDGCHKYDYYLSEKDPNELLLVEQWETKEHQQVHIRQPHMKQMRTFKDDYITNTVLGEIELK